MDSLTFSQGKLNGPERQAVLEAVQTQMQQAALAAILPLISQFLAEELTTKLGRAKGEPRIIQSQPRLIDWSCAGCGCNNADYFIRDGHYQRNLATGWGYLKQVRVPMIECQKCKHDVVAHWAILEKYAHFWLDFDQQALFGTGLCQSLRQLSQAWSATLDSQVGLKTINERINQVEAQIQQAQTQPLAAVPGVVQLDGIWLSLQTESEVLKVDKKGRKRHQRRGKRVVILVALGLWADGSGRREILDWQLAESESEEEWTTLLERLVARGLTVEAGLKALIRDGSGGLGEAVALVYGKSVLDQRCIFHKLKNVKENLRHELAEADKKQFMREAKAIYRHKSAAGARTALAELVSKWNTTEPKAVATLERDFETTIAFYQLEGVALELARSTSLLERTNRELRRKLRQASLFGSETGAKVSVYLQVQRLNGYWKGQSWWVVSQQIFFDHLNSHP